MRKMGKIVLVTVFALFLLNSVCFSGEEDVEIGLEIPVLTSCDSRLRDRVTNSLVDARRELITNLLKQLEKPPGEGSEHAIYLLGMYRAERAVPRLIEIIDFRARVIDIGPGRARWSPHPAAEALGRMGKRASWAVLRKLPKEEDELRRKLMLGVILDVEGDDLGRRIIQEESDKNSAADERARLQEALALIDFWRKGPAYASSEEPGASGDRILNDDKE